MRRSGDGAGLQHGIRIIGELLVDLIPQQRDNAACEEISFRAYVGGAPTNVAVTCHRLGRLVALRSFVGSDWLGIWLLDRLQTIGVDTTHIQRLRAELTPVALVSPEVKSLRRFEIHPGWLASTTARLGVIESESYEYLYFGSCLLANQHLVLQVRELLSHARESGSLTILDPNIRLPLWRSVDEATERIKSFLPGVGILKVNAEEAGLLFGDIGAEQQIERAHEAGVRCVIITNGPSPIEYSVGGTHGAISVGKTHVNASTGSGDVFVGSMIAYLLRRRRSPSRFPDIEEIHGAIVFAASVASRSASFPSATSLFAREGHDDAIRKELEDVED